MNLVVSSKFNFFKASYQGNLWEEKVEFTLGLMPLLRKYSRLVLRSSLVFSKKGRFKRKLVTTLKRVRSSLVALKRDRKKLGLVKNRNQFNLYRYYFLVNFTK